MREPERHAHEDERPPFGGSWRVLYAIVLLWLAAQVVIFYLFTEAFR
jgi:hypothetical protein